MTVLAKDRTISKFEFYMNAVRLRKSLIFFLLKDFGIKSKVRSPTYFFDDTWSEEDRNTINKLFHDHNYNKIEGTYPYWLIEMYRNNIIKYSNKMVENIIAAYSIFFFFFEEAYVRRNLQDLAIAACYNIKATFELMVDTIPVNNNIMLDFAGKIDKEIEMLKSWRSKDNKTIARMQTKFPEYAKFHYIKMRDVTQMPVQSNHMIDKAKFEHALKEADLQLERNIDDKLLIDTLQKNQ